MCKKCTYSDAMRSDVPRNLGRVVKVSRVRISIENLKEIMTFDDWYKTEKLPTDEKSVQQARVTWNAAIQEAALRLYEKRGTIRNDPSARERIVDAYTIVLAVTSENHAVREQGGNAGKGAAGL
jgi:hypothetical protein